jgi:large subunit ribosomal protein L17
MARSLVTYERIRTTEAKAKELKILADKLVTMAVKNDLSARRQAYKILGNHTIVQRLFDEIGPRFVGVSGGYTRVVKFGLPRTGDSAPMAVIEFTSQPEAVAVEEGAQATGSDE